MTEVPWPHLTEKHAAKRLGVDPAFLNGIANQRATLRSCKLLTTKGNLITVYNRDDIAALARAMKGA